MKYILITLFSIFLFSCSTSNEIDEFVSNQEKELNLIAPNGVKIAESLLIIKKEIGLIIAENSEVDKKINISKIDYFQVDNGYLALINFLTDDNEEKTVVKTNINLEISNGLATKSMKKLLTLKTREEVRIDHEGYTHYLWCEDTNSCQCTPVVENANGKIVVTCPGNHDCKCTIKGTASAQNQ